MAELVIVDVEDALVRRLEQRAAANKRSVEDEHRHILEAALKRPRTRGLASELSVMPDVGEDDDFARNRSP